MPLLIPPISSQKYSSIVSYQAHSWQIQVFQNSPFHLKAWVWAPATNTASCFLWSDRLTLFIFRKTSAKYPSEKPVICSSIVLPNKNGVAWKKGASWACNSSNHTSTFSGGDHCTWLGSRSALCPSHFITQNIQQCVFEGWDLMKLIIFVALSKDILKKNWLCLFALLCFFIVRTW